MDRDEGPITENDGIRGQQDNPTSGSPGVEMVPVHERNPENQPSSNEASTESATSSQDEAADAPQPSSLQGETD